MCRLGTVVKVLGSFAILGLLFWLYRSRPDDVGEMVCDMDDIDSNDGGEDVDSAAD